VIGERVGSSMYLPQTCSRGARGASTLGLPNPAWSIMTRTAEQCCALVEAIAVASSVAGLDELRQSAQREFGLDVHGSFLDVLIELRPATK